MDLTTFLVIVFCLVDDGLADQRLRQRGPSPFWPTAKCRPSSASEFPGINTDKGLYEHFRRYWGDWFPALGRVHRALKAAAAAVAGRQASSGRDVTASRSIPATSSRSGPGRLAPVVPLAGQLLSHTVAVLLCQQADATLRLAQLITAQPAHRVSCYMIGPVSVPDLLSGQPYATSEAGAVLRGSCCRPRS